MAEIQEVQEVQKAHKPYKPTELAQELNVSTQTVLRWLRDKKINALKLPGGTYRIREEEVKRLVHFTEGKSVTNLQSE